MSADRARAKRLQWKSRRGLLELDILLKHFWQQHGAELSDRELRLLEEWLEWDDDELWRFVNAPTAAAADRAALLNKLRYAHKKG